MSLLGPKFPIGDGCHAIPVLAKDGGERALVIEAANGHTMGLTTAQIVKLMGVATSRASGEHWQVLEEELGIQ